jgi:pyruvate-ferredoxin/flavodoxin oxidoreductase
VVQKNFEAVDQTLANLYEVKVPAAVTSTKSRRRPAFPEAPRFVRDTLGPMMIFEGDNVPSAPCHRRHLPHRHHPVGKAQYCARNPGLGTQLCIQCGKCAFVCPHAVIRMKVYEPALLEARPPPSSRPMPSSKNCPA